MRLEFAEGSCFCFYQVCELIYAYVTAENAQKRYRVHIVLQFVHFIYLDLFVICKTKKNHRVK